MTATIEVFRNYNTWCVAETRPDRVVTVAKTASPAAMTQHSDASSDRSEVSVTPPPPVSKVLEFASHGFLDLEHRNVLAAPLAALHSMTEMRVQDQLHRPHHQQEKSDADVLLERTSLHVERSGLTSRSPGNSSQGANPHGIDHILSRPTQVLIFFYQKSYIENSNVLHHKITCKSLDNTFTKYIYVQISLTRRHKINFIQNLLKF